jgi:hypothetical protein
LHDSFSFSLRNGVTQGYCFPAARKAAGLRRIEDNGRRGQGVGQRGRGSNDPHSASIYEANPGFRIDNVRVTDSVYDGVLLGRT